MRIDTALRQPVRQLAAGERPLSSFEFWPGWLFYAPIVAQWIALGLWHRDMSLPTAANPAIETGGLCGESKSAILDLIEGEARAMVAPYVTFTVEDPVSALAEAEAARAGAGLAYPLVVKPDIGCNGAGVRKLADSAALGRYLAEFPRGERAMLQEFVSYPGEAGVFYVREPGDERGRITSITLKSPQTVTGDGRSTLEQLVRADPRAGRVPHLYLDRLRDRLHEIPPSGEIVPLVFVGNHCRGSVFRDGTGEATPQLLDVIEGLANAIPEFHFGRIDLRFASLPELRRGRGFRVIEANGAGSEATHIWDARTTLWQAWRAQFSHYGAAWRIGAANRRRGFRPSGLRAMYAGWRLQRRLMASYPPDA